jgi:hypothetical protein
MEVEMRTMTKLVCCGVTALWMTGAAAEDEGGNGQAAAEETMAAAGGNAATGNSQLLAQSPAGGGATAAAPAANAAPAATDAPAVKDAEAVPTPPAPRIAVRPYHDKVDRAKVEKRLEDKAVRTRKRTADAEKDAAERAARTTMPAANQ